MKTILVILTSLFIFTSAFADLGVTMFNGTTGSGKTTTPGCVYVNFSLVGFTGTVGNATFSNNSITISIPSAFQGGSGQRINAIPYSVTSGTLIITEVK